ncbi:MAG: cadherin repeat domain-containing protein, partial [Cyclonatronaceae bacterium]
MMFFCGLFSTAGAQTGETARLSKDTSHQLEIPKLRSLAASDLHLYALSESDGLVVFRVHADSLQWLYSSESMQRRGNRLQADTRFAYLTG